MSTGVGSELTAQERIFLQRGLLEWGGPAVPTDAVARVIGFRDVAHMDGERARLLTELRAGHHLGKTELQKILRATELAFVSDSLGSGVEWSTTTGYTDEESIEMLRALQRKLV